MNIKESGVVIEAMENFGGSTSLKSRISSEEVSHVYTVTTFKCSAPFSSFFWGQLTFFKINIWKYCISFHLLMLKLEPLFSVYGVDEVFLSMT